MSGTLTFSRLLELLEECKTRLINEENNAIYSTYVNYLEGDKKFVADAVKLLRECDIFTSVSAEGGCDYPSEEPSLLELMLYAYLLPYGKNKSYEVTDLFIADDYRNKGYGEGVVKTIINHFILKSAKSIQMQVHKSNKVAIHIYQKCGFSINKVSPWDDDFWIMEMIVDR